MASLAAGLRPRPIVDIEMRFEPRLAALRAAQENGSYGELFYAIEDLSDVIERFELEFKKALESSDPKYARQLKPWGVKRLKLFEIVQEATNVMRTKFPEGELPDRLKLRYFKGLPKAPTAEQLASRTSTQQLVDAVNNDEEMDDESDGDQKTSSQPANEAKATSAPAAVTPPKKLPGVISSVGLSIRTGGGSLFRTDFDTKTLTAGKAAQIIGMQREAVKTQIQKVQKDSSDKNLERLREAYVLGSITSERIQSWVMSIDLGDEFERVNNALQSFAVALADAGDLVDEHGLNLEELETNNEPIQKMVVDWVNKAKQGQKQDAPAGDQQGPTQQNEREKDQGKGDANPPEQPIEPPRQAHYVRQTSKQPPKRLAFVDDDEESAESVPSQITERSTKRRDDDFDRRVAKLLQPAPEKTMTNLIEVPTAQVLSAMGVGQGAAQPLLLKLEIPPLTLGQPLLNPNKEFQDWVRREALQKAIPVFDGDAVQFQTWVDAAAEYTDFSKDVPVTTRLQVLKDKLKGGPAALAKTITPNTPQPLKSLVDLLTKEYGNKYHTMEKQIARLLKLEKPTKPTYATWRDIILTIKEARDACLNAGHSINRDRSVLKHLLSIIPYGWSTQFFKDVTDDNRTLASFLSVVEKQANIEQEREYWQTPQQSKTESKPQANTAKTDKQVKAHPKAFAAVAEQPRPDQKPPAPTGCPQCEVEDHQLPTCPVFRDMSRNQRWKLIKKCRSSYAEPLHYRCLLFHERNQCALPADQQSCPTPGCHHNHHELLHNPAGDNFQGNGNGNRVHQRQGRRDANRRNQNGGNAGNGQGRNQRNGQQQENPHRG